MGNYRDLIVWRRASDLAIRIHRATRRFPRQGAPGLSAQLHRAVASIAANIAEGAGQQSDAQFVRFVNIAIGSANECASHLHLACSIGFVTPEEGAALLDEIVQIRRMLFGLRKHLENAGPHRSRLTTQPPAPLTTDDSRLTTEAD